MWLLCSNGAKFNLFHCIYIQYHHIYVQSHLIIIQSRSSHPEVFCIKGVLRNFAKFTGKHLCQSLFFSKVAGLRPTKACNFIKKETLAQVFSCEFCETSKNIFFTEHLWATASVFSLVLFIFSQLIHSQSHFMCIQSDLIYIQSTHICSVSCYMY